MLQRWTESCKIEESINTHIQKYQIFQFRNLVTWKFENLQVEKFDHLKTEKCTYKFQFLKLFH